MKGFAISNKTSGIIKRLLSHSLRFWNSLATLLMKCKGKSAFINFSSISGISSSKFDEIHHWLYFTYSVLEFWWFMVDIFLSFSNKHWICTSISKDVVPDEDLLYFERNMILHYTKYHRWYKTWFRVQFEIIWLKLNYFIFTNLTFEQIILLTYWHVSLFKGNDIKQFARKCQH